MVTSAPARAQTAEERETARQLLDQGDEQLDRGKPEEALKLYLGAHGIMHVPTTGIEVARAYAALGKLVEARDAALEVLRIPVGTDEPKPFQNARAAAELLARELATAIPQLHIQITPAEAARVATFTVDGRRVPPAAASLPQALNPGEHQLLVTAPGYVTAERRFALNRAEHQPLTVAMVAKQSAGPSHNDPKSSEPGSSAHPATSESSKRHFSHDAPETAPSQAGVPWYTWVGIGVGGTGLLVGGIAGAVSLSKTSRAKAHCQGNNCSSEASSDLDTALLTANLSNIGFAIGATGLVLGGVSLWFARRGHEQATSAVGVAPVRHGALLTLGGQL